MKTESKGLPSDTDSESSFIPISPLNEGHFPSHVASRPIKDLVSVPMIGSSVIMGIMEVNAVVRMRHILYSDVNMGCFCVQELL